VSSRTGSTIEFLTTDDPELSTIASYAEHDHFADVRRVAPKIAVETISLGDLLAEHGAPARIDYMSVDTEGSELEILEAFDFGRYDVRLLSIEHNNTPSGEAVERLLAPHGYRRKFPEFSQWDAWYVKG
jgi:FkbM family methyltransferase